MPLLGDEGILRTLAAEAHLAANLDGLGPGARGPGPGPGSGPGGPGSGSRGGHGSALFSGVPPLSPRLRLFGLVKTGPQARVPGSNAERF